MRVRYKRRVVIAALVAIVLIALLTLSSRPPATVTALAITFIGYTNAPGGNWRFALFSVSNQASYTVRGYEDSVDVWVIYASLESSITVAGKWLLPAIRAA
jgi:hypothetical protein